MDTPLVPESIRSASTHQPSTLKGALEKLDIVPFTPESVAEYKQDKIEQMTRQLSHCQGEEISRRDFDPWEYAELNSLRNKVIRRKAYLIRLWDKLRHKKKSSNLPCDPPVIRFLKVPGGPRLCIYLQWVKVPLADPLDVPEFVSAKAREIASLVPEANFTVEQLQSERRNYDPFLIVSYADESYYIEVWDESEFERLHT
jgi:hypothetical protein